MTSQIQISDRSMMECAETIFDCGYDRIVFTNGCFDILHPGHLAVLQMCRNQAGPRGGVVVGLNSDKSVRRLKGENRPIMDEDSRARLLVSLRYVDHVITFDEDTPLKLIEHIRPDVIVKGSDYASSKVVGNQLALVMLAPLDDRWSTTKIVEKIKK